jgi:hypothetical protein
MPCRGSGVEWNESTGEDQGSPIKLKKPPGAPEADEAGYTLLSIREGDVQYLPKVFIHGDSPLFFTKHLPETDKEIRWDTRSK